jgi:hypothetical protein
MVLWLVGQTYGAQHGRYAQHATEYELDDGIRTCDPRLGKVIPFVRGVRRQSSGTAPFAQFSLRGRRSALLQSGHLLRMSRGTEGSKSDTPQS